MYYVAPLTSRLGVLRHGPSSLVGKYAITEVSIGTRQSHVRGVTALMSQWSCHHNGVN